jgi:hypothetical protein
MLCVFLMIEIMRRRSDEMDVFMVLVLTAAAYRVVEHHRSKCCICLSENDTLEVAKL